MLILMKASRDRWEWKGFFELERSGGAKHGTKRAEQRHRRQDEHLKRAGQGEREGQQGQVDQDTVDPSLAISADIMSAIYQTTDF